MQRRVAALRRVVDEARRMYAVVEPTVDPRKRAARRAELNADIDAAYHYLVHESRQPPPGLRQMFWECFGVVLGMFQGGFGYVLGMF